LENARILFVGIQGLNDYDAHNVCQSVSFFSDNKLIGVQFKTAWIEIEFPSIKRTSNLSVFDLARLMDREQVVSELTKRIRDKVSLGQFTHIAFPPILGIEAPGKVLMALQDQLGLPCFEVLAIPPSVPGYRLQKALDRLMGHHGVEIIHGRVNGYEASDRKITALHAVDKTVHYEFKPQAVVLASGKFISGGIQWDARLKETIFDLPVCVDGTFDIPAGMGTLTADQYVADQKMFAAGVRVDEDLHPVAPDGKVIFNNLYAVGSVLTGYNYTQGDGGLGIPLLTGYISARAIVKQIAGEGAVV
jgi:glycerol-3-phosphate dehydrogenase subunit B